MIFREAREKQAFYFAMTLFKQTLHEPDSGFANAQLFGYTQNDFRD
jgi:hypothetical protein